MFASTPHFTGSGNRQPAESSALRQSAHYALPSDGIPDQLDHAEPQNERMRVLEGQEASSTAELGTNWIVPGRPRDLAHSRLSGIRVALLSRRQIGPALSASLSSGPEHVPGSHLSPA
jgi:hypothetical protein